MGSKTENTAKIYLFYSSNSQPGFVEQHRDCRQFCKNHDIAVEFIDITEQREMAQDKEIITTPTLITTKDKTAHRHMGIMSDGCIDVIRDDFGIHE